MQTDIIKLDKVNYLGLEKFIELEEIFKKSY